MCNVVSETRFVGVVDPTKSCWRRSWGATSEGVSETAVAEAWTASGFGVRVRASESSKRATLRKNSSIVTHLVMSIVRVDGMLKMTENSILEGRHFCLKVNAPHLIGKYKIGMSRILLAFGLLLTLAW